MMPFHVAAMLVLMLVEEERSTNRRGKEVDGVRVRVVNIQCTSTHSRLEERREIVET